jgi:hypothetical protein
VRNLRRRTWLALLGVSLLAAAVGSFAFAEQASHSRAQPGVALVAGIRNPIQAADRTLSLELRSQHLSVQDVVCIRNGRVYRGHPIIRCNVNFGDPHVVAYCSVILAGRLVTNQQDPAIPCRPDLAGSKPYLFPPLTARKGAARPGLAANEIRADPEMRTTLHHGPSHGSNGG